MNVFESVPASTAATTCADPECTPYPNAVITADSDPVAPATHLLSVPFHNNDPVAGPSFTAIPPKLEPTPFKAIMLSPMSNVLEFIVVVVPLTVKSPDKVNPTNVGDAPVTKLCFIALTAVS